MRTLLHRHLLALPLAAIALLPTGVSADEAADARMLAAQCSQCHGTEGRARGDIDSLAGEDPMDLYFEMLEMQSDDDDDEIMHYQARGYTLAQLRLIALYFSSLPGEDGTDRDKDKDSDEELGEREKQHLEREREAGKQALELESL